MNETDRIPVPANLPNLPALLEPLVHLSGYNDLDQMIVDRDGRYHLVKTLVALGVTDRDALTETCEWILGEVYDESVDEILAQIDVTKPASVNRLLPNGTFVSIQSQPPKG